MALFFVLSGFVIAFVVDKKEHNLLSYSYSRFLRLYSVVPVCLLSTFIFDYIGTHINLASYNQIPWFSFFELSSLVKCLFFINELWYSESTFGSNHAYWSLGFEVQYYIVFAFIVFYPKKVSVFLFVLWTLFVGPAIFVYSSLWFLGVLTYKILKMNLWGNALNDQRVPTFLFFLSIFAYLTLSPLIREFKYGIPKEVEPYQLLYSFAYYIFVGVLVSVSILTAYRVKFFQAFLNKFQFPIRWLAGGTFTLYLAHEPMLAFLQSLNGVYTISIFFKVVLLFIVLLLCYILAEFGERRKKAYGVFFRKIFFRLKPYFRFNATKK